MEPPPPPKETPLRIRTVEQVEQWNTSTINNNNNNN